MHTKNLLSPLLILLSVFSLGQKSNTMNFNVKKYKTQTLEYQGKKFKVRAYENIIYVKNPVDTAYQKMNIYIPEAYFKGKTINGYSTKTAPIFFPNKVGGYMPAKPASTQDQPMGMMPPLNGQMPPMGEKPPMSMNGQRPTMMNGEKPPMGMEGQKPPMNEAAKKPLTVVAALSKGYVVASAGARGRTLKDDSGVYTGKAPAGIVDLKAAIRYLKYFDNNMPGDATKIVSNGTSAGGAMSTLLGATGDNADYEPYLKALGAMPESDAIFAVSAYCPITNLENADMAYEWQFNGVNSYKKGFPMGSNSAQNLTEEQIKVSKQLKDLFPTYLNSLKLKNAQGEILSLNAAGNGNFKEWVKSYVKSSAQNALDKGTDMSKYSFLTIENKKVTDINFDAYVQYMERQKTPPAFDALDLSSGENMLFGDSQIDKKHFTNFSVTQTSDKSQADAQIVKMMNPMNYIGTANTKTAKYWRVRHGSKDKDTGLAISVMLSTALQNKGYNVDFALPWDKPHSGDYDLDELFQWIDSICK